MAHLLITYYVVLRERGAHWNARLPMRQQEQWGAHAAFMDALADEGFIILGGPLGDGEEQFLFIIAAQSEQDILDRLADDPWVAPGLLRTVSVQRWNILLRESS